MEKWFNVGKIVNTQGIKGEVRVISTTDFPEERYRRGNVLFLFLPKHEQPIELTVKNHRTHKKFDLLQFEGYEDINEVEKFKDGILKVPESQLSDLEDGEFYYHEIIGCLMFTKDGIEVGQITDILTPGANDVWVVKDEHGKEILIPYIEEVVKKVDLKEKIVIIDPMDGLLS